jgi:NADPH:quinone reductase-like Zn-dependent oxidoreductase
VTQTFPLARAADAHRAVMGGHTTGKVVLIS